MIDGDTPRRYYPQARAILQVVLEGFGATARDTPPVVIPCLPKSCKIMRNGYNQADSWEAVFEVGDLPIDPQLIRAGAIELYLFQISESEQRVVSRREPLAEPDAGAARPRGPADTAALELGLESSKDRFTYGNKPAIVGLFDRDSLTLSDDGGWITLAGQDYTAHLQSLQWPPTPKGRARRIPVGQRVDELVRVLLEEADPEGRLHVEVRGIRPEELPIVGKNEVRGSKRGIPVEADTTYWDVISMVAVRHGLIAFVEGLAVVLSKPRNLAAQDAGRVKRMAWGVNLTSLELTRELGKQQAPTILVRGYDPVSRQTVEVEYPEGSYHRATKTGKTAAATKTTTRKSKKGKITTTVKNRDEYQIIPAYGITDPVVLKRMAQTRYEVLSRAERRVVANTHDLTDMNESDMLGVVAGDAVSVVWEDFNRAILSNPDLGTDVKIGHLVERGFNEEVAQIIAEAYAKLEAIQRPLRIAEATIEYDADAGVSIEIDAQDFIVIDGVREGDGNREGATARGHDARRTHDGEQAGWSPEREASEARRAGQ